MDGTALVHDSHFFADSPLHVHHPAGHVWQRFAIAFPLMVLAVVGFRVLKEQPVAAHHPVPAIELPAQLSNGAASNSTAPAADSQPTVSTSSAEKENSGGFERSADASRGATPERKKTDDSTPILTAPEAPAETESQPSNSATVPTRSPAKSARPQNTSAKKVSTANTQEKDSKVATFLKKTGRMLKKPFKL
jgi:hypothetical protein